jgi:hypothetical protein
VILYQVDDAVYSSGETPTAGFLNTFLVVPLFPLLTKASTNQGLLPLRMHSMAAIARTRTMVSPETALESIQRTLIPLLASPIEEIHADITLS